MLAWGGDAANDRLHKQRGERRKAREGEWKGEAAGYLESALCADREDGHSNDLALLLVVSGSPLR